MALQIPNTPSSGPQQSATQQIDPAGHFGNQVEQAANLPSVPSGLGGVAIDPNTEASGYFKIANVLDQVSTDIVKKQDALQKGVETYKLAENKIKFQQEAADYQKNVQDLSTMEGGISHKDMQDMYARNVADLKVKYFDPTQFQDPEIQQNAKLHGMESEIHAITTFKKDVIIPAQTATVLNSHSEIVNRTTQYVAANPSAENYKNGALAIDALYNDPTSMALYTPQQRVAEKQKALTELGRALISGRQDAAANIQPPPGVKWGPATLAAAKVQSLANSKNEITQLAAGGFIVGLNGDDIDKARKDIDARIKAVTDDEARRQEHALHVAERNERLADKALYTQFLGAMQKDPSTVTREAIINNKAMSPQTKDSLLSKLGQYQSGETTSDIRLKQTDANLKAGQSYAHADGADQKALADHFKAASESWANLPTADKNTQIAQYVKNANWVPKPLAEELNRKLMSRNPAVQQDAITTMRAIETTTKGLDPMKAPTWLGSLPQPAQDLYMTATRTGKPLDVLNKELDNKSQQTPLEAETLKRKLIADTGAVNDVDVRDKNLKQLGSDLAPWLGFKPEIPDAVANIYDEQVRLNYARTKDIKIAQEQALQYVQGAKGFGITDIGGKRATFFAPEKVYGLPSSTIVESVVSDFGTKYGIKPDNFQLVPTPDTGKTGQYEVWKLNPATKIYEQVIPDPSRPTVVQGWKYTPTQSQEAAAREQQAAAEAAADRVRQRDADAAERKHKQMVYDEAHRNPLLAPTAMPAGKWGFSKQE